jgi:hypothetical protein
LDGTIKKSTAPYKVHNIHLRYIMDGVVGEAPPREEPVKPFGLVRQPTVEEELGYRQPFTAKEREFSHHAIQVRVITFLPVLWIRVRKDPRSGSASKFISWIRNQFADIKPKKYGT